MRRPRRTTAAVLTVGLAIASLPARAADETVFEPVLRAGYVALAERHLEPVDLARLTLSGLRGLSSLDRSLTVEQERDRIILRGATGILARLQAPAGAAPKAWATTAAGLVRAAQASSTPLQAQPPEEVLRAFFDEALAELDPYSKYVPRSQARAARARRFGEAGLGLELAPDPAGAVVLRVIDDSPAWAAGLRVGDRIIAIDGKSTRGISSEQIESLLRGEEDQAVTLTVARGSARPEAVTLARAMVAPETVSVTWHESVPVLRVGGFNRLTDRRLARAVVEAAHRDPAPPGLVLDLRGNRGGLLRQAIAAADIFLTSGIVADARGRHPEASRLHRAGGPDLAGGLAIVVLVDGASASSAEVLAAALQDNRRAVVVGSVTTGKGLIQTVVPLPDDSELQISWASLIAPSGYAIQGLGVLPDVCTSRGEEVVAQELRRLASGKSPAAAAAWQATANRIVPAAEAARLRDACPPAEGHQLDITTAVWLLSTSAAGRLLRRSGPP